MGLCGHIWSTNDGKMGSNHTCGLEHGHSADHECASCDTLLCQELPIHNTSKYAVLSGDGFPS